MKPCIRLGPSQVRKYSCNRGDYHTSITLEPAFYAVLREMADNAHLPIGSYVLGIKLHRGENRSSHLRLKCLEYVQAKAATRQAAQQAANVAA